MSKIGAVVAIGVIGAIGVLGYVVYANAGKIGGAITRGVTQSITDPIGNFFDSLAIPSASADTGPGPSTVAGETVPLPDSPGTTVTVPSSTRVLEDKTVVSDTPPILHLPPAVKENATVLQKQQAKQNLTQYPGGYYYFNFVGSKYDYQAKLTSKAASSFAIEAAKIGDLFTNIKYVGPSKLKPAGLQLFAKSKNYL